MGLMEAPMEVVKVEVNVKVKVAELVEPPRHSKRSALAAADATPL